MEDRAPLTVLTSTPLFAGLEDAAAEAAERGEWKRFSRGRVVFGPEDFRPALGVVTDGSLEVTRAAMRMDTLTAGDLFGAAALYDRRGRYPTTLTAREDCRVLFLPRELLEDLMARFPKLALGYIAYLSDRVAFLSDRLDALGAGPAAEQLLCYLRERGGRTEHLAATRLASTLGMSRATLYRAIEALESRGLLVREGKTYTLTENAFLGGD